MERGNRTSARKRFFQNLDVEGTSANFKHDAYESGGSDGEL